MSLYRFSRKKFGEVTRVITDSFDNISEAVLTPKAFFGEQKNICDIAVATFSREIFDSVLSEYPNTKIGELRSVNLIRPIYLVETEGVKFSFYMSLVGSSPCATDVIEVNWMTGAHKFILFGSCGALDNERTSGKYIIPTKAYRDEGMSYHYKEPGDYIDIPNLDLVEKVFSENGIPYIKGRVWTTDAIYMETRDLVRKRKDEGCIAVEMELAGVQAVCDHYGFQLYDFLAPGDVVDQPDYTPEGLHEANHSPDKFHIAVKIAKKIKDL